VFDLVTILLMLPGALIALFYCVPSLRPALLDRSLILSIVVGPLAIALAVEVVRSSGIWRIALLLGAVLLVALCIAPGNPLLTSLLDRLVYGKKDD
jgi:hypothetical protein